MSKKKIRKYHFSETVAKEVGFEEAVMFSNIYFWVNKNQKDEDSYHFHDGKYWTFNSVVNFVNQYPFWTPAMINRILKKLKKADYIDTGRFNKFGYDKTKWYTVTQKGYDVIRNDNAFVEIDSRID